MRPPQASVSRGERGQILVFMALAIMFVITGVMAISVDVGVAEVSKRRLQTVADAAALAAATEKSKGGTDAAALQKARDMITDSGIVPPASNSGSGISLAEGIEVGTDVRVALKRSVGTFFANIFGVGQVTVAARAHSRVASEGVLPIAVKRFSEGNTGIPVGNTPNNGIIHDYLRPENNDVVTTADGWPNPLTSPPANPAGFSPLSARNLAVSGRIIPIIGGAAQASVYQSNDFNFWVAPDVRNLDDQWPTVVPPVLPGDNEESAKGETSLYFSMKGYPGPFVAPWTTMAILSGVSNGQVTKPMRNAFNDGDVVTAMVFDGSVRSQPDFELQVTPTAPLTPSGINVKAAAPELPAAFTVTIHQLDNKPYNQYVSPDLQLSVTGLQEPDGSRWSSWQITSGAYSPDASSAGLWNRVYPVGVPGGGDVSRDMYVLHDNNTKGSRSFQVKAYDPANQRIKMASGTVLIGGNPWDRAYTAASSQAAKEAKAGSGNIQWEVRLTSHNNYEPSVRIGPTGMPGDNPDELVRWCRPSSNPSSPEPDCAVSAPTNVSLSVSTNLLAVDKDNGNNDNKFTVTANVGAGAPTGEWLIKVPMWDQVTWSWDDDGAHDKPDVQYIYLSLYILPATNFGAWVDNTKFVHILGYANFVISSIDEANNTVYGYAVSTLAPHPEELGLGMKPRLVGWFQ